MKRILTVFLSALIVLSCITCVFIAPVSAATNLWSGLSADDWYTRQVHTQVSDPLTLEEKKMTDVYPEKFTYGAGSFTLESAGSKHYYIKMPALAKNKDFTLSFNYSVTEAGGTARLHKAIIMPESAFTDARTWNGSGAMMSGRGFLGAYDIFVNRDLSSNELNGTISYTFNTKTKEQYYLFLCFEKIDTVTYSNFKIVDPTDNTPDEEENPAEMWTSVSPDDWRTRHIQGSASYTDGRDIPEKTVAERYGTDFSYNAADKSFTLKNASGRHYYVKMPVLAKNKDYTLSFDYDAVASGTAKIDKILLVPKEAFTHTLCWQNTTGQIFSNRKNIGIQDMFVGVSVADKLTDTLTYEFNTGNFTEYYVFIKFSGISEITYSNFSVIDPELVVEEDTFITEWKSNDSSVEITAFEDSEKGTVAKIGTPWYKGVYSKLPKIEKNKDYILSFSYKAKPNTENGTITKIKLATEAGFNNAVCWSGGAVLSGDMVNDRAQYGVTDVENDISVDNTWTEFTYEFNSGDATQFYFYIRTAHILELYLTEITVKDAPEKPEEPDEIPPYSTDKTNIWTEYSADDWFTRDIDGEVYEDGRDIPEKTVTEKYGADFTYDEATKSFSLKNAGGRHYYVKLPTLEKNKNYVLGLDYITTLAKNTEGKFYKAILVPKDQFTNQYCWQNTTGEIYSDRHFIDLKDIVGGKDDGLAPGGIVLTAENRKGSIDFVFNSGRYTEFYLYLMFNSVKTVTYHNLEVYEPVNLDVVADLGGTVSSTVSGALVRGTEATVTATPDKGNNFKHWLDNDGMVVSTDSEYTFKVEETTYLKAVFGGYNKPSRELFALRGDDGTFENGSISGIIFPDNDLGFCKAEVSNAYAYEGANSLAITSYYRTAIIPLTGLNKNTDYKFSYYIKYPYTGTQEERNHVQGMMICGADDLSSENPEKIFAEATSYLAGDAGWYKVEFYFNSGENTAANFILKYSGEPKMGAKVYMDNVCLYEYYSTKELENGSMTGDIAPWLGNGEIVDNTLKLSGENTTAYQILGLDAHSRYTVKFRAKGNLFAAFSDVAAKVPDIYNAISSESYVSGNSSGFKNYSIEVYTGVHKGVALMFKSLGGDVFVDDVTVTKELSAIGGVIENVDFETDRFALTHTDSEAYEIYTAKSNNDSNVHSGKKSLHFKYNAQKSDVEAILDEAYLSYSVAYNHNYMLSLYYKFDSDTKEAAVNLEPNYRATYYNGDYGDYSGELGYAQPTTNGEWQQLNFVFTARDYGVLKAAVYNIIGKTDADFYLDDIVITVASDLVVDEKAEKVYTTDFYNMFTNPSFEKSLANTNWTNMPKTMQIVRNKNLADTADSFLKVAEGTKYILPITLNPSEVYYFGASIRTFNGGKGRIYLATLVEPTTLYFTDLDNNPKSVITADSEEWKHEGFGFRASPTGETYLVVECTEGAIGIDTVSLTLEKHANSADYNQYYPHIPFDYDNIDPSIIVYGGGQHTQDLSEEGDPDFYLNFGDGDDNSSSPSTGDSITVVSIIMVTCIVSAAVVTLTKKRKDENDV